MPVVSGHTCQVVYAVSMAPLYEPMPRVTVWPTHGLPTIDGALVAVTCLGRICEVELPRSEMSVPSAFVPWVRARMNMSTSSEVSV